MTTHESNHLDGQRHSVSRRGFVDSHAFFALFLICTLSVAIALALVGLAGSPAWLGFS